MVLVYQEGKPLGAPSRACVLCRYLRGPFRLLVALDTSMAWDPVNLDIYLSAGQSLRYCYDYSGQPLPRL